MGTRERVRRRVLSCARCRQRKIKCDAKIPSCSDCRAAGAQCVALDSVTNAVAPRSIARHLEARIALLEGRVDRLPTLPQTTTGKDHTRPKPIPIGVSQALHDMTPSFLGLAEDIYLVGCAAAPTQIPFAKKSLGLTDLDENHPRSILNQKSSTVLLESVPLRVAEFLFEIYISRIILQYPIFYTSDVLQSFDAVFHKTSPHAALCSKPEAWNVYVVSLILAISLSTAAQSKLARAQSLATGLFRTAMLHISSVLTNDLAGLQALLLLMQYTFLNPSVANLWLLTGLSGEACIDMGLHQDLPSDAGISVLERDMRRRVFWCAWEMDVAVCAGFHRQLRMQTRDINVAFPSEYDDSAISATCIDTTARRTKFVSCRIWLFRRIEADIMSILYQNEPFPKGCASLEDWMAFTENNIHNWLQDVHRTASMNQDSSVKSQWDEMELYGEIAYNYILVLLFRPCPRVKVPSRENLLKAFAAAVKVARGYWEQANTEFGYIKYVFHPCHHTFSSAVVFLQALQYCKVDIAEAYTPQEVNEHIKCFSRFFTTSSELWPAAARCLQEYERLLGPVKKEYEEFVLQRSSSLAQKDALQKHAIEGLFEDTVATDDSFNFWPVFNPLISTEGVDSAEMYPYLPYDWNDEFGFGMDSTGSL